ncbi:MAG: hypothetical protein M9916_05910 [Crocinitomicaceae bacterium]|nr:hypothetical protein [Crocinitomicaceae bacterium]
MKYWFVLLALLTVVSCKNNEQQKEEEPTIVEDYEKIEGGQYRSFYGSNNQLKMEGEYDENQERQGIWTYYTIDGKKQSVTEYKHGKKDGYSIVYHENGSIYYRGEYRNDEKVGVWDFYDTSTGQKVSSKDYGYPKE